MLHFKGPLCLIHRDQGIQVLGDYKSRLTDPGHEEKRHMMGLCLGTSDSWCSTGKWLGKVDLLRMALTSKIIRRTTLPAFLPSSLIQQQSPQASLFPRSGDLPAQGLNPGLPHCRQTLYHLSHQGSSFSYSLVYLLSGCLQISCLCLRDFLD